jgi:hypothetical protein
MLTPKQKSLFDMIGHSHEAEKDIRERHKLAKSLGVKKDFTGWLQDCLHNKWRRDNERLNGPYLGD